MSARIGFERLAPVRDGDPGADYYRGKAWDRSQRQFIDVDSMPGDLRECVHEFGYVIVEACLHSGVREARTIRHLVHEIWRGARHPFERSRNAPLSTLDWLLIQNGCPLTAAAVIRALADNGFLVVNRDPSPAMIGASMDAIKSMGWVSKTTKHRERLRAANKVGAANLMREAHKEVRRD